MTGRAAVVLILVAAALTGAALWWLQTRAFYEEAAFTPGAEIVLTPAGGGTPEPLPVQGLKGIDSDSSPIRFRACFTTAAALDDLSGAFAPYPGAVPLVAPRWFDCFDAVAIGRALERGEARAFLSEARVRPDVDRVVAVFPDGRGFAWTQIAPEAAR